MGSKASVADEILAIILASRRKGQVYVEPFCGGLNTVSLVFGKRIAGDSHRELIAFYRDMQIGRKFPEFVSEEEYIKIKEGTDYGLKGYAGFLFSFGGAYFGPYARDKRLSRIVNAVRVSRTASNALVKIREQVKGIEFYSCGYDSLPIPKRSLIYCDPPYAGTYGYGGSGSKETRFNKTTFNHSHFWLWAEQKAREGHTVFVSEYSAPSFAKEVWRKNKLTSIDKSKQVKVSIDKLFKL